MGTSGTGQQEPDVETSPPSSDAAPILEPPRETERGRRIALRLLLVVACLAVAWVASPLWVGILLGAVMAFTTHPIYRELVTTRMANRRALAAAIVTLGTGIASLALVMAALYVLTDELVVLVGTLQKHVTSDSLTDMIGPRAARLVDHLGLKRPEVVARIHDEIASAAGTLTRVAGAAAQALSNAFLGLLIALLTMYYVLLDGPRISARVERILPLHPRYTRALIEEFREVGKSAFLGTIATAIVQGVLAGLGYAIAGLPQPATWGVFTALASLFPIVGTTLVWVPIGIYLAFAGQVAAAIFVFAWGALIVTSLADYVIRPRIVGQKANTHPLLMLIALLGGIEVLGLAGLIVGPIVMSLFLAVLRIYEREFEDHPEVVGHSS